MAFLIRAVGNAVADAVAHHPEDRAETIDGKSFVVREQAEDTFAHRISETIVSSPEGKLDGTRVENRGSSSKEARDKCTEALRVIVQEKYKD